MFKRITDLKLKQLIANTQPSPDTQEYLLRIALNIAQFQLADCEKQVGKWAGDVAELRKLLIDTFAQTVEYGGMCESCCCWESGCDPVSCSESEKPLGTEDYCPQQIKCINAILPKIQEILSRNIAVKLAQQAAEIERMRRALSKPINTNVSDSSGVLCVCGRRAKVFIQGLWHCDCGRKF